MVNKKVCVLKGGISCEREISIISGNAYAKALRELEYDVTEIDPINENWIASLIGINPDVVVNGLHGKFGEDGCVQGLLELLKIPYTHSGVIASAIAMNKPVARKLFQQIGIKCPNGGVFNKNDILNSDPIERPFVIKPINEGSSFGVFIVEKSSDVRAMLANWQFGDEILVEEYIPGKELMVGVFDEKPLGVTEIRPLGSFYDYETKYTTGKAVHLTPAPLPQKIYDEAMNVALSAHKALGCSGVTRSDIRYNDLNNEVYILEVNTLPGMTELSTIPEQAAKIGISFNRLVQLMVEKACCGV